MQLCKKSECQCSCSHCPSVTSCFVPIVFLLTAPSVDVFFIDWEKPRRILAKGGGKEEAGPISCWRTLLAANEWNELQTLRLTYPAFTLIMMVSVCVADEGVCLRLSGLCSMISGWASLIPKTIRYVRHCNHTVPHTDERLQCARCRLCDAVSCLCDLHCG